MPISRCNCAGFRLLLGLALVVITWLALRPDPEPIVTDLPVDKFMHLAAFLALALLADISWPDRGFVTAKWAALMVYGVAIELAQTAIPGRFFDLADIAADATGLVVYGLVALPVLRRIGVR